MAKTKSEKPSPSSAIGLLVSVRSAEEAELALEAGANLIDVKEPSKGSLGIAEAEVVAKVIDQVAGRASVSAALGEWSPNILTEAVWHLEQPLDYIKWGLAGYANQPGWGEDLLDARRQVPARMEVVCVAYADAHRAKSIAPAEVAKFAKRFRFRAFLLDTYIKDGKSLLDFLSIEAVTDLVTSLKASGIKVAIGGSVTLEMLRTLKPAAPDWFAVRGAVCVAGKRDAELDPVRLKKWRAALG